MQKLRVGLLGATGCIGQIYLEHLKDHPFFEISFLGTSEQLAGLSLQKALECRHRGVPHALEDMEFLKLQPYTSIKEAKKQCDFVFSALDTKMAHTLEPTYAKAGLPVISNASSHRMDPDIPILVPEVNSCHLDIIATQKKKRGWSTGFIVTKSNCSILSYLLPLYPLHKQFEITEILVTTLQSISGAGYQGLSALESLNNVIPYIPDEEEKSIQEFKKVLGIVQDDRILANPFIKLSVQCMRIPIVKGHLATVSVRFHTKPSPLEIKTCWKNFKGPDFCQHLPSSPKQVIVYKENPFHPQPALDLFPDKSMSAIVGRLRPCPVLDYRFVGLTDNLKRGAALAGIYAAEILVYKKILSSKNKNECQLLRTP